LKSGAGSSAELLERLRQDPAFATVDFDAIAGAAASEFVGRSPQQVSEFLEEHVAPIRSRYRDVLGMKAELHV
jgi:adenylosuccinate lyase